MLDAFCIGIAELWAMRSNRKIQQQKIYACAKIQTYDPLLSNVPLLPLSYRDS